MLTVRVLHQPLSVCVLFQDVAYLAALRERQPTSPLLARIRRDVTWGLPVSWKLKNWGDDSYNPDGGALLALKADIGHALNNMD
eukprot:m.1569421 g.1569421  ORF g.1569421 m.1569421 type:complete len:84 (-) comp25299_c0_seq18:211-462(-)